MDWFLYNDEPPPHSAGDHIVVSWDTAMSDTGRTQSHSSKPSFPSSWNEILAKDRVEARILSMNDVRRAFVAATSDLAPLCGEYVNLKSIKSEPNALPESRRRIGAEVKLVRIAGKDA